MANFTFHPHKGFLNTKFTVSVDNCNGKKLKLFPVEYYGDFSEKEQKPVLYTIDSEHYRDAIEIPRPGRYTIGIDGDQSSEEVFIVEDAIKFGGSVYKGSYIFEDTSWCIVVMKDRAYFYNRDTKEQYVEFVSPDKINFVNSGVVLFSSKNSCEKTLYSLTLQKPILNYSEEVYLSTDTLITVSSEDEDKKTVVIHKFDDRILETESYICDDYSISSNTDTFYIVQDGVVCAVSLCDLSFEKDVINCKIAGRFLGFTNECLAIFLQSNIYCRDNMVVYNMDEQKIILRYTANSSITEVGDCIVADESVIDCFRKLTETASKFGFGKGLTLEYKAQSIPAIYSCGDNTYYVVEENKYKVEYGKVKTAQERSLRLYNSEFVCPLHVYASKIFQYKDELHISSPDSYRVVKDDKVIYENTEKKLHLYNGQILFSCKDAEGAESVYRYIADGVLSDIIKNESRVGWNWFDKYGIIHIPGKKLMYIITDNDLVYSPINTILRDDTQDHILRDGDKLVFYDKSLAVEKNITIPQHLKALSESQNYALFLDGCSVCIGYLNNGTYRQEEILDGIFDRSNYKNVVFSDDASNIVFMQGKDMILKNLASGEETSFGNQSYIEHKNGYRTTLYVDSCRRPRFLDPVNRQFVDEIYSNQYMFTSPDGKLFADTALTEYVKIRNKIDNSFVSDSEYKQFVKQYDLYYNDSPSVVAEKKKIREIFISTHKDFFKDDKVNIVSSFSDMVYEKVGYAMIKELATGKVVEEIELGPALWFLNYVAFSFDSNYVAIVGRYPDNSSYGGLYLIYDLKSHKVVVNKTDGYAIWNAAFSIDGKCCGYSSVPTTYLGNCNNGDLVSVKNKSFLTFSPDGNFIALSEQGYIPYRAGKNLNWGHQPSTNVYIYDVNTMKQVGTTISDLADGGLEGSQRAKTVISCSFSSDNSKLMMVGNDGTIIVRNIHLNSYAEE